MMTILHIYFMNNVLIQSASRINPSSYRLAAYRKRRVIKIDKVVEFKGNQLTTD